MHSRRVEFEVQQSISNPRPIQIRIDRVHHDLMFVKSRNSFPREIVVELVADNVKGFSVQSRLCVWSTLRLLRRNVDGRLSLATPAASGQHSKPSQDVLCTICLLFDDSCAFLVISIPCMTGQQEPQNDLSSTRPCMLPDTTARTHSHI